MAGNPRLKSLIRAGIGLLLLSLLLWIVDFQQLMEIISTVDPVWLLFVLVFPHLSIMVSALKWQWLLKALGINASLGKLFRLYLIGTFFSNFLPSMVGGDVVRGYLLGSEENNSSGVIAAIVVERLTGLAALVSLLVFALFDPYLQQQYPWVLVLVGATILGFLILFVFLFSGRPVPGLATLKRGLPRNRVTDFIQKSHVQLREYRQCQRTLWLCYISSFLFYFFAMAAVYSAARALGADVGLWAVLVVVPVVLLIGLLPISVNGVGINEASWLVFLGLYGVSPVHGLALGLLLRARILLTSLIGGLFYMGLRKKVHTDVNLQDDTNAQDLP